MRGPCPRPLDEGSDASEGKPPIRKRAGSIRANFFDSSGTPYLNSAPTPPVPHVTIPRAEHPVSRASLSPNALKVLYRLKDAGYQAFLVGGAVRDLLLGLKPKDFDVATNALPEEVRRLFRNCRLIGRRFRLAHVHFGNEIIEVATFRAAAAPEREDAEDEESESEASVDVDSEHRAFDTRGRILRDNLYGTIEEDVWRRDFAANSLYYNIDDLSIWDFVDGVSDLKARCLKLIGDPETRYREDPVRMLRAIRFAAKLDFSIDAATEQPIRRLAHLLDGVPPARLFDECLKLFLSGFGTKSFALLEQYGLFEHLFPMSAASFALSPYAYAREMLQLGLANTDARIQADKPATPTFLFAILLWGALLRELNEQGAGPAPDLAQLMQACDTVLRAQQSRVAIPRRFAVPMRELLMLQPRFNRRSGIKTLSLLQHPRFRAAYDFLLLRAQVGVADPELAEWWTRIQVLPQEERVALVQARSPEPSAAGASGSSGRRRRRRRGGRGTE
ncbi:MAG TPA: polynucleotide adenylyltransferase PcnB [Steroidobacteraceae bacterium]|nr:polynucleotide adenylyltransferase PcnB [Steroidobacteraceae bacterium]